MNEQFKRIEPKCPACGGEDISVNGVCTFCLLSVGRFTYEPVVEGDDNYEDHYNPEYLTKYLHRYASNKSQLNFLAGKAANHIEYLEQQTRVPKTCKWVHMGYGDYETSCGDNMSMEKPLHNYCFNCGGKVVEENDEE